MKDKFDGLNVCVIGNCQVRGISSAIKALLPGANAHPMHLHPRFDLGRIENSWSDFDLIATNVQNAEELLPGYRRVRKIREKTIFFPPIAFSGFHPDIEMAEYGGGAQFIFGRMHSKIIAAAFVLGLSQSRAYRLFNSFVYRCLGYDCAYKSSVEAFVEINRGHGVDLAPWIPMWLSGGPFMYVPVHPSIRVLATVTKLVLERAQLCDADTPVPDNLPDALSRSVIWPVYPELARPMGMQGSMTFLRGVPAVAPGESREVGLQKFVEESYKFYEAVPDAAEHIGSIGGTTSILSSILASVIH